MRSSAGGGMGIGPQTRTLNKETLHMTETHTIGEREFAERIGVARSVVAKIRADKLE